MNAARRALRYLKGSPDCRILIQAHSALQLTRYCDSNRGACPLTRQSLTGYLVALGSSPTSWKTKKQTTISQSSSNAEYRSMAVVTSELVWLKSLHASFGVFHNQATDLSYDSPATLHIAKKPIFHKPTKPVQINCHFVHKRCHSREVDLSYIPSKMQPADFFTKALRNQQFQYLQSKLGIANLLAPT